LKLGYFCLILMKFLIKKAISGRSPRPRLPATCFPWHLAYATIRLVLVDLRWRLIFLTASLGQAVSLSSGSAPPCPSPPPPTSCRRSRHCWATTCRTCPATSWISCRSASTSATATGAWWSTTRPPPTFGVGRRAAAIPRRSEEHTSELQSRENLVCRLLLE